MDKDFMPEGQKSHLKQEEQEAFVEQQEELDSISASLPDNDPLDEIVDELNKSKDQLLRISADFTNFKKRISKERQEWKDSAHIATIKPFLNIIDDFERALSLQQKDDSGSAQTWLEGFSMIHRNLLKQIESLGVTEIKTDAGFNPVFHEALLLLENKEFKSGEIIEIIRKGYMYNETVIRCTQVSVAK
ncbi:nucleotide exchange factor GrpE [Candidatus Babeliales bacterium]|nr:nucleotide exchange factor GrpE [Candidatus Babeliales bacterium]